MAIIYVYKFVDNKLDVFEAETSTSKRSDGSYFPSRPYYGKDNLMMVKYNSCILNSSSKGITQYNKRCAWIICKPKLVYRNVMWLPEYNLAMAADIFRKCNNEKIERYNKFIKELKASNEVVDNFTLWCSHKYPDRSEAFKEIPGGHLQCKICGRKYIFHDDENYQAEYSKKNLNK